MAIVTVPKKACAVNPLKMSQPIGGAFAFMGLRGSMPLLHGSQGCTSFGLTLFVRHFKEAVPLQTTAMSEVATVLGGYENVEQAILNIHKRTKPEIIGICSTGVTETKGDDVEGLSETDPGQASGACEFSDGLCLDPGLQGCVPGRLGEDRRAHGRGAGGDAEDRRTPRFHAGQCSPGLSSHAGRSRRIRTIMEDFGLEPAFLPDLAGSLDGHIPDEFVPTTIGGIGVDEVASHGTGGLDHCRSARRCGAPPRHWRPRPAYRSGCSSGCAA